MSLIDEEWQTNDFLLKGVDQTRKLTKEHQTKEKDLGLGFITYNSNLSVPCYKYDMMVRTCISNYGLGTKEFMTNKHCFEASQWLGQCVNNNNIMNTIKKYHSEEFLNSVDAHPVYSIKDVM